MNERFALMTDGQKTTTGKLVREVAEGMGFHHNRYGVKIDAPGCQFTEGSIYTHEQHAIQIAV
jgi:hypothetical protein